MKLQLSIKQHPPTEETRIFIVPAWFTDSWTEVDAFPHTSDPYKTSWWGKFLRTLCTSICKYYKRKINLWQGGEVSVVQPLTLRWPMHQPNHLISLCLGSSSPVKQQAHFFISQGRCCAGKSNVVEALGCISPCKDASRACTPTKCRSLPQRRLLFAGWTHGQLVKRAGTLWDECQTTASAKNPGCGNYDKLPEIMVYSSLVPLQGKRKQNITIGRSPWTALERKTPAPNHSQQNNHKCRMEKKNKLWGTICFLSLFPK